MRIEEQILNSVCRSMVRDSYGYCLLRNSMTQQATREEPQRCIKS